MFDDPKETSIPDTILPVGNFLLLQTDLLSQLRLASGGASSSLWVTLQVKDGLLWKADQIFVPGNVYISWGSVMTKHLTHILVA